MRLIAAISLLMVLWHSAAAGEEPEGPLSLSAGMDPGAPADEAESDDSAPIAGAEADVESVALDADIPLVYSFGASLGMLSASEPDLGLGAYATICGSVWLSESVAVEFGIGSSLMKDLYYVGEMRLVPLTINGVLLLRTRTPISLRVGAGGAFIFLEHSQTDVHDMWAASIQLGAELGIAESGRAFCVLDAMGAGVATSGAGARWDMTSLLGLRAGVEFDF